MRCRSILPTLVLLAACSEGPASTNKDATASATDSGADAGLDGGTTSISDSGPLAGMDATVSGPCDPVSGGGCDTDTVCYYVPTAGTMTGELSCRIPIGMPQKQLEETCSLGQNDCAPGLQCIQFQGLPNPICFKACSTNAQCAGLMGNAERYACSLGTADGKLRLCAPMGDACDPANPTSCAMTETCQLVQTGPECVPAGTAARGAACGGSAMPQDNCGNGLACLNFGDGAKCQEMCNPNSPMCRTMGEGCAGFTVPGVQGTFGFCQPACDVFEQMCPNNGNCTATGPTSVGCVPSGTAAVGESCGQMQPCARGGHCLLNQQGMGTCYAACDATHPCPMNQTCQMQPPLPGVCAPM
jgi:hypothetical protein